MQRRATSSAAISLPATTHNMKVSDTNCQQEMKRNIASMQKAALQKYVGTLLQMGEDSTLVSKDTVLVPLRSSQLLLEHGNLALAVLWLP